MLVGIDGSPSSEDALSWAVAEAGRRGTTLRVLSVVSSVRREPPPEALLAVEDHLRTMVDRVVRGTGVDAVTQVVAGKPGATLSAESADAAMVVVGSRGLTRFDDLLIGSVAIQVATHARAPVVVVRGADGVAPGASAERVVVGVDEGGISAPAIAFAFEEAALRGAGVTAVHVVRDLAVNLPEGMPAVPLHPEEVRFDAERVLGDALAGWPERYPHVDLRRVGIAGTASQVLIEESAGAALLVVGSRGSGGFRGLLLGSVSQAVVHHAHCPVAVVRAGTVPPGAAPAHATTAVATPK